MFINGNSNKDRKWEDTTLEDINRVIIKEIGKATKIIFSHSNKKLKLAMKIKKSGNNYLSLKPIHPLFMIGRKRSKKS